MELTATPPSACCEIVSRHVQLSRSEIWMYSTRDCHSNCRNEKPYRVNSQDLSREIELHIPLWLTTVLLQWRGFRNPWRLRMDSPWTVRLLDLARHRLRQRLHGREMLTKMSGNCPEAPEEEFRCEKHAYGISTWWQDAQCQDCDFLLLNSRYTEWSIEPHETSYSL